MTDFEVGTFLSHLRTSAADDLTRCGYDATEAARLADRQITAAFPQAEEPSEHRVRGVVRDGVLIGHVWFGPAPGGPDGNWWLYELNVTEAERGGGVGAHVIALVKAEVRRSGGSSISLRVFDHNDTARSLYRHSGYREVSTLMRKVLWPQPRFDDHPSIASTNGATPCPPTPALLHRVCRAGPPAGGHSRSQVSVLIRRIRTDTGESLGQRTRWKP